MTIAEIKKTMTDMYISDALVQKKYNLVSGKSFEEQFSKVSIESILFYITATCVWVLYRVFGQHKEEVDKMLSERKPHRLKWYRDKTLAFQEGYTLMPDSDVYATLDTDAQVVKYAAAVELSDSSKILIKIATGDTKREMLPTDTAKQVFEYISKIKDAGVRVELINQPADMFRLEMDIYYDAILPQDTVKTRVNDAVVWYIENLNFNAEYSNMGLVKHIASLDGVVIAELKSSKRKVFGSALDFSEINAKCIPDAGYMRAYNSDDIQLNMIVHDSYEMTPE